MKIPLETEPTPRRTALQQAFSTDGLVRMPEALTLANMTLVEAAFEALLTDAEAPLQEFGRAGGARFANARGQSPDKESIIACLRDTPICRIVAEIFGSGPVWYHGEQLFLKDARTHPEPAPRTPRRQDGAYLPFSGSKLAIVWINLDPVDTNYALEFVRGSHNGPLYAPPTFSATHGDQGFFDETSLPALPPIQAQRDLWDIVSWPADPGDMLIFHTGTLHGGGGVAPGSLRRSLTLRFVGDDVVWTGRPGKISPVIGEGYRVRGAQQATLSAGEPYHLAGLAMAHPGLP